MKSLHLVVVFLLALLLANLYYLLFIIQKTTVNSRQSKHDKDGVIIKQLLQEKSLIQNRKHDGLIIDKQTYAEFESYYKKVSLAKRDGMESLMLNQHQHLKWMDLDGSKGFSGYGDGSCSVNKDRKQWQKIFSRWVEIAKEKNIRYFLSAGSLLGAWRDGDVIPYDDD